MLEYVQIFLWVNVYIIRDSKRISFHVNEILINIKKIIIIIPEKTSFTDINIAINAYYIRNE